MNTALLQQALETRYVLTKANVDDLITWLRAGHVNRAVIALGNLIPAKLAQPVPPEQEPVYQYQLANGQWIDQTKDSYDYNVKLGQAIVRVLYTLPQVEQPVQPTQNHVWAVSNKVSVMLFWSEAAARKAGAGSGSTYMDVNRLNLLDVPVPPADQFVDANKAIAPALQPLTDEQYQVLAFLDGRAALDGCRFGEMSADLHTKYWWRKNLKAAFAAHLKADHIASVGNMVQPLTDEVYRLARVAINEAPKHLVQDWQTAAMKVCKAITAHNIKAEKD